MDTKTINTETKVNSTIFVWNGKEWEHKPNEYYSTFDESKVYERLTNALIAKKMHKCSYISRITDTPLYNDFRKVEVYYRYGEKVTTKEVFIIKDWT